MKPTLLLRDEVMQMFLLIYALFMSVCVDGEDFYCDENKPLVRVSGNTTGHIITLYQGETFYRNNQNCHWLVDTGSDNSRIQLTVNKSELEWAPEGATCFDLYDYIHIRDGNSTTSKSIAIWCGYESPRSVVSTGRYVLIEFKSDILIAGNSTTSKSIAIWCGYESPRSVVSTGRYVLIEFKSDILIAGNSTTSKSIAIWCGYESPRSVVSTGRYVLIEFKSDPRNHYNYGGVQLAYNIFQSTDCPMFYSAPSNSQFCYSLVNNRKVNWNTAQAYCGFDQANLVSIQSQIEHNFLKSLVSGSGVAWIGLSKIVREEEFSWIDNSILNYTNFDRDVARNSDEDCVVFDFDTGLWSVHDCLRFKANFFCKTNKGKPTHLFGIPEKVKIKKDGTAAPIAVILGAIFGSAGVILVVVVVVIVYIKCFKGRSDRESSRRAAYSTSQVNEEAEVGPKNLLTMSNRRTGPVAERNVIDLRRNPLPPPVERSSQLVAPPTYEDALNDPVFNF